MRKLHYTRIFLISLLIVTSALALAQTLVAHPSLAQLRIVPDAHAEGLHFPNQVNTTSVLTSRTSTTSNVTNTGNLTSTSAASSLTSITSNAATSNVTSTSVVVSSQISNTSSPHGRHAGGVPPGLLNAWAHSNMSAAALAVTHAIFLNGTHGVELAQIAIAASTNGQLIRDVAFNETVAKIDFDRDGSLQLTLNSSIKPRAVYADDMELTELPSAAGLNPNSEAWVYDQNNQSLRIFADPTSVTLFYESASTPVPEFPEPLTGLILTVTTALTVLFVTRKKSWSQYA
jgi:hypothetical protein